MNDKNIGDVFGKLFIYALYAGLAFVVISIIGWFGEFITALPCAIFSTFFGYGWC